MSLTHCAICCQQSKICTSFERAAVYEDTHNISHFVYTPTTHYPICTNQLVIGLFLSCVSVNVFILKHKHRYSLRLLNMAFDGGPNVNKSVHVCRLIVRTLIRYKAELLAVHFL